MTSETKAAAPVLELPSQLASIKHDHPIERMLIELDNHLVGEERIISEYNSVVDTVVRFLQKLTSVKVDRVCIGGSMGKKTYNFYDFDVDLVIFLNNQHPPYNDVLKAINREIEAEFSSKPGFSAGVVTRRCIHNLQIGWVRMDVVPATNLADQSDGPDRVQSQAKNWNKKFQDDKTKFEDTDAYNPSLQELETQFMQSQPSMTHRLARLLKFWAKRCLLWEEPVGLSYTMELVAVRTFQMCKPNSTDPEPTLLRLFCDALSLFLGPIRILWEKNPPQVIRELLQTDQPVIVSACNRFNCATNHFWKSYHWEQLRGFARNTLRCCNTRIQKNTTDPMAILWSIFRLRVSAKYASEHLRKITQPLEDNLMEAKWSVTETAGKVKSFPILEPCVDTPRVRALRKSVERFIAIATVSGWPPVQAMSFAVNEFRTKVLRLPPLPLQSQLPNSVPFAVRYAVPTGDHSIAVCVHQLSNTSTPVNK